MRTGKYFSLPVEPSPQQSRKQLLHAQVERDFTSPMPHIQKPCYQQLRDESKKLAHLFVELVPDSFELEQAHTLLHLAIRNAIAGIERFRE